MEESSALDVSIPAYLAARLRCPQCGRGVLCLRARRDDWVYVCDACSTMERAELEPHRDGAVPGDHPWPGPGVLCAGVRNPLERPPIFEAAEGSCPGTAFDQDNTCLDCDRTVVDATKPHSRPPIFEAAEVPKQERAETQHVGPLTEP